MYKKLLLSAGGGIVSPNQQAEQAEVATIAIGLGGTGVYCLSKLKNEVYNHIKPDIVDGDITEYRHIKFLAIDSDPTSIETNDVYQLDKHFEYLNICCTIRDEINNSRGNPMWDWVNPKCLSSYLDIRAYRHIYRALIIKKSREFVNMIELLIANARAGLPGNASLNINIFTGMCGGTGSGIFLDVCFLVNYVLEQLNLPCPTRVYGYFFLPDINIRKMYSQSFNDFLKLRGFAAMKELDYCMNFSKNGGEWEQQYDGFEYKTNKKPVDLAFLVSATNINNEITTDDTPFSTVVNHVLENLIKLNVSDAKNANDSAFTIESHIANIKRCIEMVPKKYGACYDYCVLGASNTYLPYKEITTYLASKIFESFNYLNKNTPNENDLDLFIHSNGLKYEDISRELTSQLPIVPNFAVDTKVLQEQCQGITPDTIPNVLTQMRDSIPKISGALVTNKKNLINGAENTLVEDSKNISSLISRVKTSLVKIASDPSKGPYYAAAFLHSNVTKDLQNKVDGYIERNAEEVSYARADLGLRETAVANTLREFQNAKLSKRGKGEAYVSAVHAYFLGSSRIDILVSFGELLKAFKKQLEDLYSDFFKIFTTVLDNLTATFNANLTVLSNPTTTYEIYSKPLMTITDLKDSLDNSVAEMRIPDIVNHFIDSLMDDEMIWISQDENKISKAVTKFFLSELDEFTNKTIVDYLQIKFETTNPNLLESQIYNNIMIPAHNDANPLFWTDASKYTISDASKIGYCSVPEISPEIQNAADQLHQLDDKITKQVVESTDRISIFEFLFGVPMFGCKYVSEYYDIYKNFLTEGVHIYEGYGSDAKDFRKLPDILPYSSITVERTQTQLDNSDEYDFALENGIITVNDVGEYRIGIFDENNYNSLIEQINKVIEMNDLVAVNSLLNELPQMPMVSDTKIIKNDSSYGYEAVVAKDNALASLNIISVIKEQNDLFRKYLLLKSKLKDKLNVIK